MFEVGKPVPDFTLDDQNGDPHSLADYRGKKVLIYFYPKDMTPGCTVQAKGVRDAMNELKEHNLHVLGISTDSIESHKKFAERHELNFSLLADEKKDVVEKYGVWVEKSMYGNKYMGTRRDSFLIDEEGKLIKHFEKISPKKHVPEVLKTLKNS